MTRAEPSSVADFEPLRRAERLLLKACARGDIARVGLRRPKDASPDVTVRAAFVAFLARGGDEANPVRSRRIQLLGAWIDGRLDLGGDIVPLSLWFYRCVFDTVPLFDATQVQGGLAFPDCELPGLMAEGCKVSLDLALNAGCSVSGEVRLRRAHIGADLLCSRLKLQGHDSATTRRPMLADSVRIDGDAFLNDGLEAFGELRFVGAQIGGDFHAGHARITGSLDSGGARQSALVLDRARVGGSVVLDAGFAAAGRVSMRRVRIDGDLDCTAAAFDMLGDATWGRGVALVLDQAEVGGSLILQGLPGPLLGASLAGATRRLAGGRREHLGRTSRARWLCLRPPWRGRARGCRVPPGLARAAGAWAYPWHGLPHAAVAPPDRRAAQHGPRAQRERHRDAARDRAAAHRPHRTGHARSRCAGCRAWATPPSAHWRATACGRSACSAGAWPSGWLARPRSGSLPKKASSRPPTRKCSMILAPRRAARRARNGPTVRRCRPSSRASTRWATRSISWCRWSTCSRCGTGRRWAALRPPSSHLGDAVRWLGWLEALFGWLLVLLGAISLGGWAERDRRDPRD